MSNEMTVIEERRTLSVQDTMDQLDQIRQLVAKAMKPEHDYGVIPGTNGKNVMLLAGAQKTVMYFNCTPEYAITKHELPGGHVEVDVTCSLTSRANGKLMGQGIGSCSTMETKYRWRKQSRQCPHCCKETIIKGRAEYGGGWLCWKKKGGCGSQFADNDKLIIDQPEGRVENEDIADARNTVLKMAKKRAVVDAALGLGCMSELFTQDIEPEEKHEEDAPPAKPAAKVEKPAFTKTADDLTIEGFAAWLATAPILTEFNSKLPELAQMKRSQPAAAKAVWNLMLDYANGVWVFDLEAKSFLPVQREEVPA